MRGPTQTLTALLFLILASCGASTPSDRSPASEWPEESADDVDQTTTPPEGKKRSSSGDEEGEKGPPPEPEFKDGMSVSDAINAVPQGTPRVNIDQETLGEPLKDPKTWAACKLTAADHFKITVAVWNGRAVGIDLEARNKKDCIVQAARAVTWRDKVKSLNSVEYSQ